MRSDWIEWIWAARELVDLMVFVASRKRSGMSRLREPPGANAVSNRSQYSLDGLASTM